MQWGAAHLLVLVAPPRAEALEDQGQMHGKVEGEGFIFFFPVPSSHPLDTAFPLPCRSGPSLPSSAGH